MSQSRTHNIWSPIYQSINDSCKKKRIKKIIWWKTPKNLSEKRLIFLSKIYFIIFYNNWVNLNKTVKEIITKKYFLIPYVSEDKYGENKRECKGFCRVKFILLKDITTNKIGMKVGLPMLLETMLIWRIDWPIAKLIAFSDKLQIKRILW